MQREELRTIVGTGVRMNILSKSATDVARSFIL
jgi:hypothetical protein